MMHSIEVSAAVTCWVLGSDWAMSSPSMYKPLNSPSSAASNMFGMRSPGSLSSGTPQAPSNWCAHRVVRDMPVAGELVREGAHVAGALHVVLTAQRIDAHAFAADVAGGHGEIGNAHHHGRTLAVLGDAEPVVDGAVAAGGIQARRCAHCGRRHAGDHFHGFRRVAGQRNERAPFLEGGQLAALAYEVLLDQTFGDDDVRQWN